MAEIWIGHIADLVAHNCSAQLRPDADLRAVSEKTVVIQYDKRRADQPASAGLYGFLFGGKGESAQSLHLFAQLFLCDKTFGIRFLVYHSTSYPGKVLQCFCLRKFIHSGIFHRDHKIPDVLIPLKIGLPRADHGQREKALHECKSQERQ